MKKFVSALALALVLSAGSAHASTPKPQVTAKAGLVHGQVFGLFGCRVVRSKVSPEAKRLGVRWMATYFCSR